MISKNRIEHLCLIERTLELPRKSSEVFGNLRKILENVQKVSYALRTTLWKTSIGGQNSSENRVRVFFWSWPPTKLLFTIVSRAQILFRVQLEINLHLWVFFFRSGSCNFQFFEKLTRANNSIPYDYLCKQYYTWCMIFLLVLNK